MEQRSETKKRQDEARELGKAAGRSGASERLKVSLKDKHCLTDVEVKEFEKGVKEGEKEANG